MIEFIVTYCVICALAFVLVLLGGLAYFCLKGVLLLLGAIWYGGKRFPGNKEVTPSTSQIPLKNTGSADGKLVVRNVKRSCGFYSAEIVDAETGCHVYSVESKDIDTFENRLASELDWWSRHPEYKNSV